jgi:hypothetical protein
MPALANNADNPHSNVAHFATLEWGFSSVIPRGQVARATGPAFDLEKTGNETSAPLFAFFCEEPALSSSKGAGAMPHAAPVSLRRNLKVPAAPYPHLQTTQGRATLLVDDIREGKRLGHPPSGLVIAHSHGH